MPDPMNSPFRLAVAAHFVHAGQVGGAEHMLYNLLRGLWQQDTQLEILVGDRARLDPGFRAEIAAEGPRVRLTEAGGTGVRFLAEQRAVFSGAKWSGIEADATLFPNYYVPPLLPRRLGRIVCVLHDLQYRHFSMNFSARKRAWLRMAHAFAVRRCDRLVVISEFVRQDALRFLGAQFEHKIVVVPNPISWDRFGTGGTAPPGPPRILYCVGRIMPGSAACPVRARACSPSPPASALPIRSKSPATSMTRRWATNSAGRPCSRSPPFSRASACPRSRRLDSDYRRSPPPAPLCRR